MNSYQYMEVLVVIHFLKMSLPRLCPLSPSVLSLCVLCPPLPSSPDRHHAGLRNASGMRQTCLGDAAKISQSSLTPFPFPSSNLFNASASFAFLTASSSSSSPSSLLRSLSESLIIGNAGRMGLFAEEGEDCDASRTLRSSTTHLKELNNNKKI